MGFCKSFPKLFHYHLIISDLTFFNHKKVVQKQLLSEIIYIFAMSKGGIYLPLQVIMT